MTATKKTITGHWSVAELQSKCFGEWVKDYDFDPGDWTLHFYPNGRMNVRFRAESGIEEYCAGSWAHDPIADYILFDIDNEEPEESRVGMVFDPTDDGPWLYSFIDMPFVRPDREEIIDIRAFERLRLVEM